MESTQTKMCSRCKQVKPTDQFGINRSASDQLQSNCRDCQHLYGRERTARRRLERYQQFAQEQAIHQARLASSRSVNIHVQGTLQDTRPTIFTKRCSRCKTNKPLSEYYHSTKAADNLQSYCKECTTETRKLYAKRNQNRQQLTQPPVEELKRQVTVLSNTLAELALKNQHLEEVLYGRQTTTTPTSRPHKVLSRTPKFKSLYQEIK